MASTCTSDRVFALSGRVAHKAAPALIAIDVQHFQAVETRLRESIAQATERLEARRRARSGANLETMERDQDIHRLSARLGTLRRFGLDICLGRMVDADGGEPVYVGRIGLTDGAGRRLLVDWRSPAAEPFFAATPAFHWVWPAAAGTAGPGGESATTGTRY